MSALEDIEQLAGALLAKAAPATRRKLLRTVSREIGKSQRTRIAAQKQPDDTPFVARKPKPAAKGRLRTKGQIKRDAMFRKLRLARFLRDGATDAEAWVGFAGRVAGIARVHQEGLLDRPSPKQKPVVYAKRTLIGVSDAERARVLDLLMEHVSK